LVPPGRKAGETGNQLSSDHFERAADDLKLERQKIKIFSDLCNACPDADLGDSVVQGV